MRKRKYLALLSLPLAGEPRKENASMVIEGLFLPPQGRIQDLFSEGVHSSLALL